MKEREKESKVKKKKKVCERFAVVLWYTKKVKK